MLSAPSLLETNHKTVLITVGLSLIGLNFYFNPINEDFYFFRVLRPIICFGYLLLFLLSRRKNDLIQSYLIVFAIASLFSVWFRVPWVAIMTLALEALSLPFLIKMVYPRVRFRNPGLLFSIVLGFVAAICALLLIAFIDVLSQYLESFFLLLTVCSVTTLFFILLVLTFIYNSEANTKASLVFIFFLIFLVFSEMLRGVGYYEFIDPVIGQQVGRVLLVIAHSLLFHFSYLERKNIKLE